MGRPRPTAVVEHDTAARKSSGQPRRNGQTQRSIGTRISVRDCATSRVSTGAFFFNLWRTSNFCHQTHNLSFPHEDVRTTRVVVVPTS